MKLKLLLVLILILLISSVQAAKFIGSFTVKDSPEQEQKTPLEQLKEFLKNLPIAGNFAIKSIFSIAAPPDCYTINDQETIKNIPLTLNYEDIAHDPNNELLTFALNFTYNNSNLQLNQIDFTETIELSTKVNYLGTINYVVIKATDSRGLFCYSNPFKITVKEIPPPQPPQPGGGSPGGGGGSPSKAPNFILSKNAIELEMYPLEEILESVNVTNIGNTNLNIKVINDFPGFIQLITKEFPLQIKQTKQADFLITAPDLEPDIYVGRLKFTASGITRTLNLIVNLVEKGAPVILQTTVQEDSKRITPGDKVTADIIINIDEPKGDLNIQYQIRTVDGRVLITETETISLQELNTKIEKTIQTREEFEYGFYQFFVILIEGEKEYKDSDVFEITAEIKEETPGFFSIRNIIIITSAILLFFLALLLRTILRKRKLKKVKKKKKKSLPDIKKIIWSRERIRRLTIEKLIYIHKTIDKGDFTKRYLLVLNEFLRVYYSITYRFTTQEAIKIIKRRERNKHLIQLLDTIGYVFYMKKQPTKQEMDKIIASTIRILQKLKPNQPLRR